MDRKTMDLIILPASKPIIPDRTYRTEIGLRSGRVIFFPAHLYDNAYYNLSFHLQPAVIYRFPLPSFEAP